jgi:hypothetical protein
MPFYQSLLHGRDFHMEDEDGSHIVGFYTGRKVHAADERQAEARLRETLPREEKVAVLISQSREAGSDPKVECDEIFRISMWRYLFEKCPRGFIFYSESEEGEQGHREVD